jgi:Holliday junction resolvase RusA-like endonuclease
LIKITIKGKPIALKRHRSTRSGRMYDPSAKDKKQIWLQIARFKPKRPLEGQIMLFATFYMPRPKKHFRTGKYANILKDGVPEYVTSTPDLSNLIKLYEDILQPSFYLDDSQICRIQAEKIYSKQPRTEIIIEEF